MADEMSMQEVAQRLEALANGFQRRFDQMDARFDQMDARFDQMDARFDRVDARLDRVDVRLDRVDARLDQVDVRLERVEVRLDRVEVRLDGIDARLDGQALRLDSIDEKARLALEAHEVLRESMDRQFRAASEKADERHELLKDIVRRTSLRVGRLEARRKRR